MECATFELMSPGHTEDLPRTQKAQAAPPRSAAGDSPTTIAESKSRSHRQRRHRGWQQTRRSRSRNLRSLNQHPELIPPHSTKRRRARSGGCQSRCQARLSPHEQPKPQAIASHQFRSVRKRIGEPSELLKQPPHCQGDGSAGRGRRAQRLRQNFRQFPYRTEIVRVERESVHFVGQLTLLAPGPLTRLQCLACR